MFENLQKIRIPRTDLKANCELIQKNVCPCKKNMYRENPQLWIPQMSGSKLTFVKDRGLLECRCLWATHVGAPGRAGLTVWVENRSIPRRAQSLSWWGTCWVRGHCASPRSCRNSYMWMFSKQKNPATPRHLTLV